MSLLWAMGTVEVQLDVHAQNVMALEKILKDVKSDARKLQSKQVEFYLSVCQAALNNKKTGQLITSVMTDLFFLLYNRKNVKNRY